MKKTQATAAAALLLAVGLFVPGCYTQHNIVDSMPKFHDGGYANVVIRFYQWDDIFIVKPDHREGGFLRALKREEIASTLSALKEPRDMVVVVMGCTYKPEEQKKVVDAWKAILQEQGYKRIVCLRASDDDQNLNGMPVIGDSSRPASTSSKRTAKL